MKHLEASNHFAGFLLSYYPGIVHDLPVVSPFARKLIMENRTRRYSDEELIRAFETDIFLSAKLFSVANSIFFNLDHRSVFTVREALQRVGTDYASNLVRDAAYFSDECDLEQIYELWRHCMAVAHAAKALCPYAANMNLDADAVFLVALIHDIGYLLEIDYDLTRLGSVISHLRCGEAETESHLMLGESLANFWSLPDWAKQAIRWHHTPAACRSAEGRGLAALIYLAETLVTFCLSGQAVDVASCAEALSAAGIKQQQFVAVQDGLRDSRQRWTFTFLRSIR